MPSATLTPGPGIPHPNTRHPARRRGIHTGAGGANYEIAQGKPQKVSFSRRTTFQIADTRLANIADLAAPFQMSRPTFRDYVTLLERVFLVDVLPPWHTNRLSQLVKSPKLHIGDTGIACALLGLELAQRRPPARQTKLRKVTFPIIAGSPSGQVVTNEIVQKALATD